jgi:CHAT domain-containing protein/tetratricopeptide (TPR) repeat protein
LTPDEGSTAATWCERLIREADDAAWAEYDGLPSELREQVTTGLKSQVDQLAHNTPPEALPVADLLVRAAADLPQLEPLALRGRGVANHYCGDNTAAIRDLMRAAELYETLGQPVDRARVLRSLVEVNQIAGQTADALECARLAEEILSAHGERRLLGELWLNLGNLYTRIDDYAKAASSYHAAKEVFEELEDGPNLARIDFNLAVVAMNGNRCEDAEDHWMRARDGMETAGLGLHVADCDYNVAYLHSRSGRFERAIDGLERARVEYHANGKPSGPPLCDLDLAEINLRLGAHRDALRQATAAAAAFETLGMGYELARAEVLAGLARSRLGDGGAALTDLARAEERFLQQGNATYAAFVGLQRVHVELSSGNASRLLERVRTFRLTLSAKGTTWLANLATLTLARVLLQDGQADEALKELDSLGNGADPDDAMDDLLGAILQRLRADALAALGDRDGAIASLEAAVSSIDTAWGHVPQGDVRIAFFRGQHPAFVDMTCLLLEAGRSSEALLVYEHGRSRSLLEAAPLAQDPAWRSARDRLDWLLTRQLDAELGPLSGGNELRRTANADGIWTRRVAEARNELARMALDHRGAPTQAPGRLDPGELVDACSPNERLLTFVTGPRGVHVLVLHADANGELAVDSHALDVTSAELAELRDRFWFQARRRKRSAPAVRRLRGVLAELGERLLAPVVDGFQEDQKLVVVPSGPLHDLPLHACELDGQPLASRFAMTQDVSVWHLARTRRRPAPASGSRPMWCSGATLGVLPAVARELEHLKSAFPERVERLGAEDLVTGLGSGRVQGALLHLAAHGRFEATRPRFSAICLGERFLLAHDVASLSLDLDLVVLSGCETGRSLSTGGDELIGLPRAFLGAGARSVLGTLWPVGDDDAAGFMHSFYNQVASGASARHALTAARREALATTSDPVAWAAFTLLGDPDVVLAPGQG